MDEKSVEELFKNKTVLITGGTGFLGRHLTREILKFNPSSVRILSRDEVKHHNVHELFENDPRIRKFIGDVRDFERLKKAVSGADIVIHAAALKRLDILEYNVEESIKTNIVGTLNVVNACLEANVGHAVMVSSDKACSPVNTYGASKFVGERIFTESNYSKGSRKTIFTTVRYGNVLESTGSVIPLFEDKIKRGQEIPLTDERMTRFIISGKQAVELIFDALKYSVGGEIFVPILPAFRIIDLINVLKAKHSANNSINVIGIRPGEKLHELMINGSEIRQTFKFKNRYVITSQITNYQDINRAPYFNESNRLSEKDMSEYSSEHSVVSQDELEKLFKQFGLL